MHYTLKDHQGNLTATIQGNTVERLSYDAWGRRRNPVGFGFHATQTQGGQNTAALYVSIPRASRSSHADRNAWDVFQCVGARFQGGARGEHVVDKEDVLSF